MLERDRQRGSERVEGRKIESRTVGLIRDPLHLSLKHFNNSLVLNYFGRLLLLNPLFICLPHSRYTLTHTQNHIQTHLHTHAAAAYTLRLATSACGIPLPAHVQAGRKRREAGSRGVGHYNQETFPFSVCGFPVFPFSH